MNERGSTIAMLYNPNWNAPVEPTLAGMVAWLETKGPDETYNWADCRGRCLVYQYAASIGTSISRMSIKQYNALDNGIAMNRPWTFGAALARAKAKLAGGVNG